MEENDIESTALDRALKRRFSLLEKTRIHRLTVHINLSLIFFQCRMAIEDFCDSFDTGSSFI